MPHLLAPDVGDSSSRSQSRQRARTDAHEHRNVWSRLSFQKIGSWLRREEEDPPPGSVRHLDEKHRDSMGEDNKENGRPLSSGDHARHSGFLHRRSSRKAVPGLPRPLTFKRMNSEKREKLLEVPVDTEQRRAASADRRSSNALTLKRTLSPTPINLPSISAPDVMSPNESSSKQKTATIGGGPGSNIPAGARQIDYDLDDSIDLRSLGEPPPLSIAGDSYYDRGSVHSASDIDDIQLQEELEAKWILNLSMHFRDMSDREKFFITFAEEPTKWRRVTVSCDYRELTPDSLESDLKTLHYQRDKSARIYEAIRDSLPDIQFYDTVTNLKLQTSDGRLHVHVTEDVNEIIPYPSLSAVHHLDCKKFKESAISFDSHISGFVYKVSVNSRVYIKKEIPGPDAVEEFLYEINALCSLQDSNSVIRFEGIIVDEKTELIKGLLISYAEQGALVDLLYDFKGPDQLIWERRERWAKQIVEGLSEIHEAGFVQGDFTLSNIVVDHNDDAKIIDINRRGCPVGWEPPELAKLIESGQRISIYIGVKSDLFQLGMVLWALAEQHDEPERQERPLTFPRHSPIPDYFREIVRACLSDRPRDRPAAKAILARFPTAPELPQTTGALQQHGSTHRSGKEYIDPSTTVNIDDIPKHHQRSRSSFSNINMPSTEYITSNGSYIIPNAPRGRSPSHRSLSHNRRSDYSPYPAPRSIMSLDDSELENELASLPASRETRWEQVYVDGDTKLVQRGGHEIDTHEFANQEPKDVCITTPPGELDSSFVGSKTGDDTPLGLSALTELPSRPQQMEPSPTDLTPDTAALDPETGRHSRPLSKASFSDRLHQLVQADDPQITKSLAELENEVAGTDTSVSSSAVPSRVGTGFSVETVGMDWHKPYHQDSGFSEPILDLGVEVERVSYEAERIRYSLENKSEELGGNREEAKVDGRLWDEREGTMIEEGAARPMSTETITPPSFIGIGKQTWSFAGPIGEGEQEKGSKEKEKDMGIAEVEKALAEKTSNNTIRPPSILIPERVCKDVQAVEASHPVQPVEMRAADDKTDEKEREREKEKEKEIPPKIENAARAPPLRLWESTSSISREEGEPF